MLMSGDSETSEIFVSLIFLSIESTTAWSVTVLTLSQPRSTLDMCSSSTVLLGETMTRGLPGGQ